MSRKKLNRTRRSGVDGSRNKTPIKEQLKDKNALDHFFLRGWVPDEPFIHKNTNIIAFGSCFAVEVTNRLKAEGLNVFVRHHRVPIVETFHNFNTTFTIRQQFEWAFKGWVPDDHLWWDIKTRSHLEPRVKDRVDTRDAVLGAEVFIITLGLSEVWFNSKTGGAFWYPPNHADYDPEIHKFHISTVKENYDNLKEIWGIIKENNPDAKVVFSLSPIPLVNTYRDTSAVTSNTVSKAILRVAIDEFMRSNLESVNKDLFYWPSYEIAKEYFVDPYLDDNRHLKPEVIDTIMDKFVEYFVR